MSIDLEALGSLVPEVPGRDQAPPQGTPYGRLTELGRWWRTVSPDISGSPASVRHLWGDGGPVIGAARSAVVTSAPFDVPGSVDEALEWAVAAADDAVDQGVSLLVVSVPGAPVLTLGTHLLGLAPVPALGWPAELGLGDAEWSSRVAAARDGLRRIRELAWPTSAQVLEAIGSPELAAGVAVLLQATARSTPCLLDGPGASVCALLARHVARRSTGWIQAACDSGGRVQKDVLESLALEPLTSLAIAAEDGTAGLVALALLETASVLPAAELSG